MRCSGNKPTARGRESRRSSRGVRSLIPRGAFVLDFFCAEMMFAVEIHGGIHLDPEVAARDTERQRTLEERHIQFFRWTAAEVEKDPAAVVRQLAVSLGIEQLLDQAPLLPDLGEGAGG